MRWTDFIIVYFEKLNIKDNIKKHQSITAYARLWLGVFCLFACTQLSAYEIGRNSVNAPFDIKLSTQVKEAVDNGIVLNFECELAKSKKLGPISWASNQKKILFRLTHHSLSNRYLVHYNEFQAPKNFDSASEATTFITEQSIKLFRQFSAENSNTVMRLSLNKFKLLGPMRLNAFISEQWNIDTGWISWSRDI